MLSLRAEEVIELDEDSSPPLLGGTMELSLAVPDRTLSDMLSTTRSPSRAELDLITNEVALYPSHEVMLLELDGVEDNDGPPHLEAPEGLQLQSHEEDHPEGGPNQMATPPRETLATHRAAQRRERECRLGMVHMDVPSKRRESEGTGVHRMSGTLHSPAWGDNTFAGTKRQRPPLELDGHTGVPPGCTLPTAWEDDDGGHVRTWLRVDAPSARRELEDTGVIRESGTPNYSSMRDDTLTGIKRSRPQDELPGDPLLPLGDAPLEVWEDGDDEHVRAWTRVEHGYPTQRMHSWEQQEGDTPDTPVGEAHTQSTLFGEGLSTQGRPVVSLEELVGRARMGIG